MIQGREKQPRNDQSDAMPDGDVRYRLGPDIPVDGDGLAYRARLCDGHRVR